MWVVSTKGQHVDDSSERGAHLNPPAGHSCDNIYKWLSVLRGPSIIYLQQCSEHPRRACSATRHTRRHSVAALWRCRNQQQMFLTREPPGLSPPHILQTNRVYHCCREWGWGAKVGRLPCAAAVGRTSKLYKQIIMMKIATLSQQNKTASLVLVLSCSFSCNVGPSLNQPHAHSGSD